MMYNLELGYLSNCSDWMNEESGFDSRRGQEIFLGSIQPSSATDPACYTMSTGEKQPGREAD